MWTVIALLLPLGIDTFVVSAALGAASLGANARLRSSLAFAIFEGGAPALGLVLGQGGSRIGGGAAFWMAVAILISLGLYTVFFERDDRDVARLATGSLRTLALLAVSVSMDEVAIGFSLGLLAVPVLLSLGLIAAQAVVVSQLGMAMGAKVSARWREGGERFAGVALLALAAWMVTVRLH